MGHYKHFTLEEREKLLLFYGTGTGNFRNSTGSESKPFNHLPRTEEEFQYRPPSKEKPYGFSFYLKRTAPPCGGAVGEKMPFAGLTPGLCGSKITVPKNKRKRRKHHGRWK